MLGSSTRSLKRSRRRVGGSSNCQRMRSKFWEFPLICYSVARLIWIPWSSQVVVFQPDLNVHAIFFCSSGPGRSFYSLNMGMMVSADYFAARQYRVESWCVASIFRCHYCIYIMLSHNFPSSIHCYTIYSIFQLHQSTILEASLTKSDSKSKWKMPLLSLATVVSMRK